MTIETREVLAGAYLGSWKGRSMLTHAVVVDQNGAEVSVLCRRVRIDSIADHYAQDTTVPPTCPLCVAKLRRR